MIMPRLYSDPNQLTLWELLTWQDDDFHVEVYGDKERTVLLLVLTYREAEGSFTLNLGTDVRVDWACPDDFAAVGVWTQCALLRLQSGSIG